MVSYIKPPESYIQGGKEKIASFIKKDQSENIDWETVESFGEEWSKFDHFSDEEIRKCGEEYFDILPKSILNDSSLVLDVGCGTGRWTYYLCDKVGFIDAIDPSKAVLVADSFLAKKNNIRITQASVDSIPFPDNTYDLVFSLGVLHHIPDTLEAMRKAVDKVKPGGYFLVYLYYNLDNRGFLFKTLFKLSNVLRNGISKSPQRVKSVITDLLAVGLYMPFVLVAKTVSFIPYLKKNVNKIPLSYYRNKSFNIIRNDSLDRFGTPLEQRFSKVEIEGMMKSCGLKEVVFSTKEPYWHAVGKKG